MKQLDDDHVTEAKTQKTKNKGISVTHWRVICDSPNLHYNPSVRCDGERLTKPQI
jgi:hypothetical protein